jgi:hypothetical protein
MAVKNFCPQTLRTAALAVQPVPPHKYANSVFAAKHLVLGHSQTATRRIQTAKPTLTIMFSTAAVAWLHAAVPMAYPRAMLGYVPSPVLRPSGTATTEPMTAVKQA